VGKVLKGVAIAAAFVALAYATGGLSVVAAGTAGAATVAGVTFTTTFLGSMLVSMAAASILTGISQQFLGAKMPKTQLSRLNVSLDPSTPRKVVFGTTAMPLDLRYHESSGTDQEYIDYIIAVAAHKVASITEIWFEEKQAWTLAGGVTATYSGYLTVAVVTEGTAANYISINGGTKWGSSRRLTGCAYLHLRIKRTGNVKKAESPLASGLPSRVTVIGDGALLYDPRKDSTVPGGSGSHRANNQATWGAYTNADDTDNPALHLLWWMLGWEINGKLSVGCGIPYNRIDMASFITAANICDENITLSIGGTQKRYRASGTASDGDDRSDIINNLLISMNATLRDNGGKLTVTAMKNDLADYVLTFNENDMYGEFDWQQTRGLTEHYNVIRGRYVDPSANSLYQMVDYPEIGFAASDGVERVLSVDLSYIEDGRRAQRLAKQILQRNQYRGMFSTTFNAKALGCQVGDVVRINLESLGWSNKLFRVVSQEIRFDGQVPMALIEENAAIYAWDADDLAPVTPTAPTIYDPLNNPLILGINEATVVSGYLTNEAITLAADASGNVISFATATGTFKMFEGTVDVTTTSTFALTASSGITATINATTGVYSVTAMSASTGSATFTGTYNGTTITKSLSVAKSQEGAAGSGAASISGYLTKEVVQLFAYANGGIVSYTPASGSFKVFSGNTDVSTSFALSTLSNPESLTVSYAGQTYSVTAGFDNNEDTASVTIRATGSGAYAGVTVDKVFSLSKAKGGYEIVATLPSTDLFEGRVVFLTTDDKLYRYTGSAWTAAVPAVDITGTLADAQIAAIAAAKVTGQITGTQITDSAISSPKIAAGAVIAGKLAASSVQAGNIAASAVTAGTIAANAITATEIATNAITADKILAGAITAAKVSTNEIVALSANIKDGVIQTAKIGDLQVSTLKIANFAVNSVSSVQTSGSIIVPAFTTSGTILSLTFTKVGGTESNILIQVTSTPNSSSFIAYALLNRTGQGLLTSVVGSAGNGPFTAAIPLIVDHVDAGLFPGTYTYTVNFDNQYSSAALNLTTYAPVTLTVQEVKK
jgi:hypothetical protein